MTRHRVLRCGTHIVLAAASGWLAFTSYEPLGWWPMAIIAIALLYAVLYWSRQSYRWAATLAMIHALTMYACALPWIGELVGTWPYAALTVFCSLSAVLTGAAGAAVARWRYGFLAFPFVYVVVEWLRSSFPFGGFAWLRLAWGQIDGPLASLASIGGPALVSFATALLGTSLFALFIRPRIPAMFSLVIVFVLGIGSGIPTSPDSGKVEVAAIQGNVPRLGLDFNAQRAAVVRNHLAVTNELADSGTRPDLIFWPENSSDINPFVDRSIGSAIQQTAVHIDAPILVGTVTSDNQGYYNTMQVFDPVTGPGDYHRKVYLQPFGEYVPWRAFFRSLTDLVDLASDFTPGNGTFTVSMDGITVGVSTCFEVIVDNAYRTAVRHGAQILTTPTNNATFGFSNMTYQQLAMSRLRAIETDRAVVVAATSGVSAIILPDGTVRQHSQIFESAALVDTLPLKDTQTIAVRWGDAISALMTIMGTVLPIVAVWNTRRQ